MKDECILYKCNKDWIPIKTKTTEGNKKQNKTAWGTTIWQEKG